MGKDQKVANNILVTILGVLFGGILCHFLKIGEMYIMSVVVIFNILFFFVSIRDESKITYEKNVSNTKKSIVATFIIVFIATSFVANIISILAGGELVFPIIWPF